MRALCLRPPRPVALSIALASALSSVAALAQQQLDRHRFDELFASIQQDHGAPWRTIPWRIDLLAAQREAAASRRPLFIWAMDGHPLGCT